MNKKCNLLFFGELPPFTVHGISYSNQTNLDVLAENLFNIQVVEESQNLNLHGRFAFSKFFNICKYAVTVFYISLTQKFNVFYTNFPTSTFGLFKLIVVCIAYKLGGNKNIVAHLHRGDFEICRRHLVNRVLLFFCARLVRTCIVLDNTYEKVLNKYIKNVLTLPNTIHNEYHFFTKTRTRTKTFVFISNYLKEKGILELLIAFNKFSKKHPDYYLKCYGNFGDEELKKKIIIFQSNPNIQINLVLVGEKKFKVLYEADALILPSHNEGQPLIILEAMSVGTPVIVTDVGFIPNMLPSNYPYLYKSKDLQQLTDCMNRYIKADDLDKLSSKLLEIYNEKFSQKIHKTNLLNIFNKYVT